MKVKCIVEGGMWFTVGKFYYTGIWPFKKKHQVYSSGPIHGDILTVASEYWDEGEKYYKFVEWPGGSGFTSHSFEPIDETYEEVKYSAIVKQKAPSVN